jgi:hypothetical protein
MLRNQSTATADLHFFATETNFPDANPHFVIP